MKTVIGVCEARNRFPELLRQVRGGRRFTITSRSRVVADLVPSTTTAARDAGAAIDRFRAYMRKNQVKAPHPVNVRALIDADRV